MTSFGRPRLDGVAVGLLVSLAAAANAQTAANPAEQAQALVERAAAHIQTVGRVTGFADISRQDGGFTDGVLYVACHDLADVVLAHGGNPQLVGKNLSSVRDSDGKQPMTEINRVANTQGKGWVEYLWPNAQAHRIQRKVTYVLKVDAETICSCGYYKSDAP